MLKHMMCVLQRGFFLKRLLIASIAMTFLVGPLLPAAAQASNPRASTLGVIRWDGQVGDLSPVGLEEERILGPAKWSDRLPFYATKPTADTATLRCTTQGIMDQEIAYAKEAGIGYWAFCWYGNSETDHCRNMNIPRNLYLSSSHKNDVNWCAILFTHPLVLSEEDWFVARMGEANYQKVLGNRPLIYCFNYSALVDAAQISRLRTKCANAGIGNPYVVALDFSTSGAQAFANQIGADAISSYCTSAWNGQPYSSLTNGEKNAWTQYKNTGRKVIPWVTTGWDARPRDECNPDYAYAPNEQGYCSPDPTPAEIAGQLQNALNWNYENAGAAEANTVLMYSWNEFSEGGVGTVCPKLGGDRTVLDAVKNILVPGQPSAEVIVDNDSAGCTFTGTWLRYTGQGFNGSVHCKLQGDGSAAAKFTPVLTAAGDYDVYARWSAYTNRATNSPYTVYYNGGSQTIPQNQQINGDTWVKLGTWNFAAGTAGYVRLADNANGQVIADAVKFVPVAGSGTSFVTGISLSGTKRNNFGSYVGMKITVGSQPLTVKQLGRYFVPGNSGTHNVKIVNALTGTDLINGGVYIDMGAGTADSQGFKYADLAAPVTLAANSSYYIISSEADGGDQWHDYDSVLSTTGAAVVNSGVYYWNNAYSTYGSQGNSYGPVNFKY